MTDLLKPTNRLADTTSPYLQQHADNPVDWWPWCPEALTLAREMNRPILLSIGYSACHWCHVMAHESFEDKNTAALMNRLFVNIKVDREERPDLDKIYQTAHQLLARRPTGQQQRGGQLPQGRPRRPAEHAAEPAADPTGTPRAGPAPKGQSLRRRERPQAAEGGRALLRPRGRGEGRCCPPPPRCDPADSAAARSVAGQ